MTENTEKTPLNGPMVRARRKALSLTQKNVAQYMGVTDAAVSQWERGGGIEVRKLHQLAKLLQTSADELINRGEEHAWPDLYPMTLADGSDRVPVVSLKGLTLDNMLSRMQEALGNNSFLGPPETITPNNIELSKHTLTFIMSDQSMEPEYAVGEYVTVDLVPPEPGDHIVAHVKSENATVFRAFEYEGSEFIKLSPINPKYRVLRFTTEEFRQNVEVIGVMIGHLRGRRVRHTS